MVKSVKSIETLEEAMEEVDFVEIIACKVDQTTHLLIHVKRDATYA